MRRKLFLFLVAAIVLFAASPALAQTARLSFAQAKAAMRHTARPDRPLAVTFTGCRRLGRATIGCWVTEHDAQTLIFADGQPIVGDLSYEATATRHAGRVRVH